MNKISLKNEPNKIILHCSDTPDSGDRFGASDIDLWHKQKGWEKIGYHYVIRRTGKIEIGRPENEIGAHTQGFNHNSLGICYIGTKRMTLDQIEGFLTLYKAIRARFDIEPEQVYGHYEFNEGKTCPGQDMNVFRHLLETMERQGLLTSPVP